MENETHSDPAPTAEDSNYEPPKVEDVMSADDLAREVHYAGTFTVSDPGQVG